jgi:nucleotidyltransferase substrate binding protein (TIGR01987 family)
MTSDDQKPVDLELFGRTLAQLHAALSALDADQQNSFIRDSVVKRYEFTYELALRSLSRFLQAGAFSSIEVEDLTLQGVVRRADRAGLLLTGWPEWRRYREARNQTAHTYSQEKADAVIETAREFAPEADNLLRKMTEGMARND